jgi:WD40 repeat protein
MIAVGTHDGKYIVFDCKPKLRYNYSFTVRNRLGRFALGRKVTNIQFINHSRALISTNDSRIRFVNMSDGKMIHKYKGLLNEESMIRAYYEYVFINFREIHELVICASADGMCYIWNLYNKEHTNKRKNYSCEFFKPFEKDIPTSSIFLNDICSNNYIKKVIQLTTKVRVSSIILNVSQGGRIQVLLNCENLEL